MSLNNANFKFKQVIVVRTDIKMSKGKIAAQVAHAAVTAALEAMKKKPEWFNAWLEEGQKKVVLKVNSDKELIEIYNKALAMNLPVALIRDMGLTEIPPGTLTTVAIGPAPEDKIDRITGKLKLLR